MIKRVIEISRQPTHLSARLEQVIVQPLDCDKSASRSIPAEDIGLVMIDQPRCSMTTQTMAVLMRHGAALVVCGHDHLPLGMMLPLSSHTQVVWRLDEQLTAGKPLKKRLWQQVIRAKILAQAGNLATDSPARKQLVRMAGEVKSGDSTHMEGQAARVYWSAWLEPRRMPRLASSLQAGQGMTNLDQRQGFRRDAEGVDPLNAMLNYGYAVLRAAVGRALVSSGLLPALGLHHRHRSNVFCLADDMMEPLRPMVDDRVRTMHKKGFNELDQSAKAELLNILVSPVCVEGKTGPLMVSLSRMTASLVRCYQSRARELLIPTPVKPSSRR